MRNQNKQRYLIRYLSIFALLFAVVIVKTSCNKLDTGFQTNLHPANFTEQFFTTKTTPSSQTANLIQKLKDENANNSFVANLPKNCGLPIWEKVVFRKQAQDHNEDFSLYSPATHGPSANFDLTGDSSELAVIPLTITDSALSSVLLVKDENGTITTTCITTNGNLYDVVHGTNITLATEQLVLFFYMENETYGTDKFYHIPTTLFPQSTQVGTDGKKIITLSDNDSTSTETSSFRFCKKILVLCECGQYPCPVGNSYEYEVCVTINPPNGGGTGGTGGTGTGGTGTGGTGTGGTGGGGGGGGGGTGTGGGGNGGNTNCNDPFYSNFGPCGPNNPPPPPPVPPCDTFINTLQNNVVLNDKISYLEQDSVFDKNVETGFTGILGNNNAYQYRYAQGEPVTNRIGTINFYKSQYFPYGGVDVIMHCHADNGANVNLNCIFSPADVTFMASNLLNSSYMYRNNSNFAFIVTAKGFETNTGNPKTVTYMLKVTDLQAFTNFAIEYTGANGNDGDKMENFENDHNYKFENKNIPNSEREFLRMLKVNASGVGSGLSLYKSDNSSGTRKWSRLNLNGNTVQQTNCY